MSGRNQEASFGTSVSSELMSLGKRVYLSASLLPPVKWS